MLRKDHAGRTGVRRYEVAAEIMEDGELCTIGLCRRCYNQRHTDNDAPKLSKNQRTILVGSKRARGIMQVGLGAVVLARRRELYAIACRTARKLLDDASEAWKVGEQWINETLFTEERTILASLFFSVPLSGKLFKLRKQGTTQCG